MRFKTKTTKNDFDLLIRSKYECLFLYLFFSVCGTTTIKKREDLSYLNNCTVIEGNLVLSLGVMEPSVKTIPTFNESFPQLREITDYFLVYESRFSVRLTDIFPNLAVIRGNKLLEVCS